MIIEFLFMKFKIVILGIIFPLYIMSHLTYEKIVTTNDRYMSELWENRANG